MPFIWCSFYSVPSSALTIAWFFTFFTFFTLWAFFTFLIIITWLTISFWWTSSWPKRFILLYWCPWFYFVDLLCFDLTVPWCLPRNLRTLICIILLNLPWWCKRWLNDRIILPGLYGWECTWPSIRYISWHFPSSISDRPCNIVSWATDRCNCIPPSPTINWELSSPTCHLKKKILI